MVRGAGCSPESEIDHLPVVRFHCLSFYEDRKELCTAELLQNVAKSSSKEEEEEMRNFSEIFGFYVYRLVKNGALEKLKCKR
ncbi:hypothetical protein CEXT_487401 [Caerostris extrusa]|uniref:Uncharacterized protein n=1 Tax=Caerostris extrusa TaxID=172846 RepID=A0AAV4T4F9_CAEEX|nr:hypothetical protein CEXT_487401 [Caerostris extrusa]